MWKVPVLLWVLGRTLLWVPAEGAITVRPEDDITTLSVEDGVVTLGASEEPYESASLTAQVPTNTKSPDIRIEDLPTPGSTGHGHEESHSATALNGVTSHSVEDTQPAAEKDGLATGTLIGVIVGVLLAIGFIGGLIIVVRAKNVGKVLALKN